MDSSNLPTPTPEEIDRAQHGLQELLELASRQGSSEGDDVVSELMQDDDLLESLSDLLGDDIVTALSNDISKDTVSTSSSHRLQSKTSPKRPAVEAKVELPNKFTNYEMFLFRSENKDKYLPKETDSKKKKRSKKESAERQRQWVKNQKIRAQQR